MTRLFNLQLGGVLFLFLSSKSTRKHQKRGEKKLLLILSNEEHGTGRQSKAGTLDGNGGGGRKKVQIGPRGSRAGIKKNWTGEGS